MRAKLLLAAFALGLHPASAYAAADPALAALQRTLFDRGLYAGPVDGVRGPATDAAVRAVQRRARIAVDGIVGPQTRQALSLRELGARPLRFGTRGTDVLTLQFALSTHGFPCGTIDGVFGLHTANAVRRF